MEGGTTSADLSSMISTFSQEFTAGNFWAQIAPFAGIIAALVIFRFAYRTVKKVVNGASKGKQGF